MTDHKGNDMTPFLTIILNCSDEQMPTVEKFLSNAFSEELSMKIKLAQKLKRSLRIEPVGD